MTMTNVISGFRSTGVYPLNCHAMTPASSKPQDFNPISLSEKTGLKYIPLYSPARQVHLDKSMVSKQKLDFSEDDFIEFQRMYEKGYKPLPRSRYCQWLSMYHPTSAQHLTPDNEQEDVVQQLSSSSESFTASEVLLFERRRKEGWDLQIDPRYNQWLQVNSHSVALADAEATSQTASLESSPAQHSSAILGKFLKCPTPAIKIPSSRTKSSGRVLTSVENKQEERKEKARQKREDAEKMKQKRQAEREEKKRKAESKGTFIVDINCNKITEHLHNVNSSCHW